MIICLSGGLGNQLFQYALGCSMKEKYGIEIRYDESVLNKDIYRKNAIKYIDKDYKTISQFAGFVWGVKYKISNGKWKGMINETSNLLFEYKNIEPNCKYLKGCWQNVEYFQEIKPLLIKNIDFTHMLNTKQEEYIAKMHTENSIAVHVRRGDYLKLQEFYFITDVDYYIEAMQFFHGKDKNCKFYFFSDDIQWCRRQFENRSNCVFIEGNDENSAFTDFEMMRNCKNFIISNSTFSWWASWLSTESDKIMIAPKEWFCNKHDQMRVIDALLREYILI